MSKGLEALKRIENQFNQLGIRFKESGWHIREDDYFAIEKELKALEIIKEKDVHIVWLKESKTLEAYNKELEKRRMFDRLLTQEEFNLLKEVLNGYVETNAFFEWDYYGEGKK
jgi:hypothetical protein